MNTLARLFIVISLSTIITGCATSGYMTDRGRDAADIFTASAGAGIGAKVRLGPVQVGLITDCDLYGLRGGTFGDQDGSASQLWTREQDLFLWSKEVYAPPRYLTRGKGINAAGGPLYSKQGKLFYKRAHMHFGKDKLQYYTQLEAVVALGPSFRIGFNPGEFVDFILGWFGVDIYNDDRDYLRTMLPPKPGTP